MMHPRERLALERVLRTTRGRPGGGGIVARLTGVRAPFVAAEAQRLQRARIAGLLRRGLRGLL